MSELAAPLETRTCSAATSSSMSSLATCGTFFLAQIKRLEKKGLITEVKVTSSEKGKTTIFLLKYAQKSSSMAEAPKTEHEYVFCLF